MKPIKVFTVLLVALGLSVCCSDAFFLKKKLKKLLLAKALIKGPILAVGAASAGGLAKAAGAGSIVKASKAKFSSPISQFISLSVPPVKTYGPPPPPPKPFVPPPPPPPQPHPYPSSVSSFQSPTPVHTYPSAPSAPHSTFSYGPPPPTPEDTYGPPPPSSGYGAPPVPASGSQNHFGPLGASLESNAYSFNEEW